MRALVPLLAALVVAAGVSPSRAASFYDDCMSGVMDRVLAGCAKVVARGAREHPKNRAAAYYNMAWAHEEGNGDHDLAIADLDRALALNPTYGRAYVARATAYGRKGDDDKALADYGAALAINPKDANALEGRGQLWANKGDSDKAITDLSAALLLSPQDSTIYEERARAYADKTNYVQALADYDKAIALAPDNPMLADKRKDVLTAMNAAKAPVAAAVAQPTPAVARADEAPRATASQGERLALVIGNSAYATLPKLDNPTHDAADLAEALGGLGFQVTLATDVDRDTMEDKLAIFAKAARHADVALIFFSGHGLQFNNVNYLVPVDARVDDETDLRHLIPVAAVLDDLENAPRVRLLILDACRETGALQRLAASLPAKRGVSVKRGLARDDAEGTFIAYSTQPGSVADDGSGSRNSPFTTALLNHLTESGVDLRVLFTRVRGDVFRKTNGAQNPEVSDSLVGEFAFK